jgi:predicted nucleotidyltransferase
MPCVERDEILKRIRSRLAETHGDRLRGIVLYGSEARGDARPDSDIDLLVLLEGPLDYGRDLKANLDALYPLALELGRRISAKPVSHKQYETVDCPLYSSARREGIIA